MSKLLLDESPLVILPKLAVEIGLNEAVFIQQLHYWLTKSKNAKEGRLWSYNSFEKLQDQFPFWSLKTIQRIVKNLKQKKLLLVENYNRDKRDKTNWYSIDYDEFEALLSDSKVDNASGQNDLMEEDNMTTSHQDNMTSCNIVKSLTENTTENTTEKKNIKKDFSFSLKQNTQHENLSQEYKDKLKAYAVTKDGAYSLESFLNYHLAKGSKFKDWSRAYNTWLINTHKYQKINPNTYLRKIPHPTLENVYAEYGVSNAYDGDKLEFIGSFVMNSREEAHDLQSRQDSSNGANSVEVAQRMKNLAQKVRS